MKRNQLSGFILAGLLMFSVNPAGASLITSFTSDPALGSWSASNINPSNPGSYVFSSDTSLIISASANANYSEIILTANVTRAATLNISWTLNNNGNSGGAPIAGIYVMQGATIVQSYNLAGSSGQINYQINLSPGEAISFDLDSLYGTQGGKTPATLEIDVIPEAGTWLAGVFLFGIVACGILRRKSEVSAPPAP